MSPVIPGRSCNSYLPPKDHLGNVISFKTPALEEAIRWRKGKIIINLDKKHVLFEMTSEIIRRHQASAHVMITVHTAEQARYYYDQNNDQLFSAFVRTMEEFQAFEEKKSPGRKL